MIEFNHLSYEKVHVNFKKNYAGFIKLRSECLNSIKLGANSHGKWLKFNHFSDIKHTLSVQFQAILVIFLSVRMIEFNQIMCEILMESDWNSVIFLSVRMIEFNHLSYEKVHVNFKKNFSWKVIEIQSFFGYKNTHYMYNSNDFSNFLVCKNDWIQSFIIWKSTC